MKRTSFVLLGLLISAVTFSQQHEVTGTWLGTIDIGVKLRLVFHFTKMADGSLTGTTDSPDQGATDIPLSEVTASGDSIRVKIKSLNAVYNGSFVNDSSIDGVLNQAGMKVPLLLAKIKKLAAAKRPQTPLPPFSYNTEDVEYDNANKSVHFGGTFTHPKEGKAFAAVILITGSGQQDRDETLFEHKPFAVMADYLTKKGYAVLRVDDRGIGKTSGAVETATSADFAKDVEAAIAYVSLRKEVDKKKIGLLGHSEGGIIAPMVAAKNKNVSFIILWGAGTIGGLEINTEQNAYSLQKAGISEAAVNAFKQLHKKELQSFKSAASLPALHSKVKSIYNDWRIHQPKNILQQLYATDSTIVSQSIDKMYDGLYTNAWMRFFITHDFAADLAKVKCPVLAINGEKDTQVDAKANLALIERILKKNLNPSFKIVPLAGLNHLLQQANTGDVSEYGQIEETISPIALDVIGTWLDKVTSKK